MNRTAILEIAAHSASRAAYDCDLTARMLEHALEFDQARAWRVRAEQHRRDATTILNDFLGAD